MIVTYIKLLFKWIINATLTILNKIGRYYNFFVYIAFILNNLLFLFTILFYEFKNKNKIVLVFNNFEWKMLYILINLFESYRFEKYII